MPVRDEAAHLDRAIRSIVKQKLSDWELVAVDDGSTDRTPAILAHWAQRDERIRVLTLEHVGLVAALNLGLQQCRGTLVARMDADDFSHPWRLASQAHHLQKHPEVALVSCRIRKMPRRSLRIGMLRYEGWLNSLLTSEQIARDIYVESPVAHPSVMLRRTTMIDELNGYRDMGWPEDYDMWLRLHQAGGRMEKLPETLLYWSEREERHSRTSFRYSPNSFRRLKAYFLKRGPLRHHREVVMWGAGRIGKRMGLAMVNEGFRLAAFVDLDPDKIGQTIHGAPVVHPTQLGPYANVPILSAVGKMGVREEIRRDAAALGRVEGRDFWCVA
jgi:glycosyltransferase involved in cell wall biosynthesis